MSTSNYPADLIKDIAEGIDMGMIYFLNTDTHEFERVLSESYDSYRDDENSDKEMYDKVESWPNRVRIDPPESWESFKIMEGFIESCIPDGDPAKHRLSEAIARRKPFQNFKSVIDGSPYRQAWFDYKQSRLETFVLNQITPMGEIE